MKSPIETFHQWSLNGRDLGMEEGHASSVEEMLNFMRTLVKLDLSNDIFLRE